ncbi:MAG: ATP-binding protein, partial [Candidatus Omnitrophica bacterium]|nr:ATP-binding protein [Candidatus Omnitrophota bacterium]
KDNVKEFINIIYHDSNRLAHLIDDLLDLSKIESGKLKMVFLPVDILEVIKRTLAVLEPQAKKKSISISLNVMDSLPKVLADPTRLSQVILNLLDNAIKYTPDGGKVSISIFTKDKFVQVDIADTGIGIPQESLSRIFERFYRVDKARSRELGGTGLGLSIVKHIVLAHGGQVWVKSEEGLGSTFSFTIPQA